MARIVSESLSCRLLKHNSCECHDSLSLGSCILHGHFLLEVYDIVGPVCESGDTFAKARSLVAQNQGDLVAFRSAGAYGAVMASEYNTRPLIPEVLVNGDQFAVIRARPSYDEIIKRDALPDWL